MNEPLLALRDLHKHFPIHDAWGRRAGWLRAVDGVSMSVARGAIVGVVGESGCGKTTLGKTIVGIHRASSGEIRFEGNDIGALSPSAGRALRRSLQYCYQDPGASLDPHWKIGRALEEPLVIHTATVGRTSGARACGTCWPRSGLPEAHLDLYPHEISGGQQRRVGTRPHPDAAADTGRSWTSPRPAWTCRCRRRCCDLLLDLRERFDLTYLFISHDLAVVRLVSQRIAVMYLGKVVETGGTETVFAAPRHPYTQSLLAAVPIVGGRRVTEVFWLEENRRPRSDRMPLPHALPTCRSAMRGGGAGIASAGGWPPGSVSFRISRSPPSSWPGLSQPSRLSLL